MSKTWTYKDSVKKGTKGWTQKKKVEETAKKVVKRQIQRLAEHKRFDFFYSLTNGGPPTAPVITDIFSPAQGNTDTNRNGDRSSLTSFWLDLYYTNSQTTIATSNAVNSCRVIVFQWHPNTVPIANDIVIPTAVGPDTWSTTSVTNRDTKQQYTILLDKIFVLSFLDSMSRKTIRKWIKLKKAQKQVQFVNGGTVGTNKIYVMNWNDGTFLGTPPAISYSSRIFFDDL